MKSRNNVTLKEAQKKVRIVRTFSRGNNKEQGCRINLPICYKGKKVKVNIVR